MGEAVASPLAPIVTTCFLTGARPLTLRNFRRGPVCWLAGVKPSGVGTVDVLVTVVVVVSLAVVKLVSMAVAIALSAYS